MKLTESSTTKVMTYLANMLFNMIKILPLGGVASEGIHRWVC
jgi:hypothetical protein